MASFLPTAAGLLPKWLALVSGISFLNGLQAYVTANSTRKVYNNVSTADVSPLARRLFGTWTITSGMIRLYAAYNINSPEIYVMTMWTFAIAFAHFVGELLLFKSLKFGPANTPTFVIASGTLTWMFLQWSYYLG